MPFQIEPNLIEQSDFSGGWSPDVDPASAPNYYLLDALNVLADLTSGQEGTHMSTSFWRSARLDVGSLVTRKGFRKLPTSQMDDANNGYYVKHIWDYRFMAASVTQRRLVMQTTNGTHDHWWEYDIDAGTTTRIDDDSLDSPFPEFQAWGQTICGVFYFGQHGVAMSSWDGSTFTANVDVPNYHELKDSLAVTTATQRAKDYGFNLGDKVKYESHYYSSAVDHRFTDFHDATAYNVGDEVSYRAAWGNGADNPYYRSFRCILSHTSSVGGTNEPGIGATYKTYWHDMRNALPVDGDGNTSPDWNFIVQAEKTSQAGWFGDRMWQKYTTGDNWMRAIYSAPVRDIHDQDVADVTWDPTNWEPAITKHGEGGGWESFGYGGNGDEITAFFPMGDTLLVFGRKSIHAVVGVDNRSWNIRLITDETGCQAQDAIAEKDGLVYFLSEKGLYQTDGNTVEPVGGFEKVREYWFEALQQAGVDHHHIFPQMRSFQQWLVISVPNTADDTDFSAVTTFFNIDTESFWQTDLPISAMCVTRYGEADHLIFSTVTPGGSGAPASSAPFLFSYGEDHSDGDAVVYDDDTDSTRSDGADRFRVRLPGFIKDHDQFSFTYNSTESLPFGAGAGVSLPPTVHSTVLRVTAAHIQNALRDLTGDSGLTVDGADNRGPYRIQTSDGTTLAHTLAIKKVHGKSTFAPTLVRYQTGGAAEYAPITWLAQSSWFHFATPREDRRVRRMWALIQAPEDTNVTLKGYANFETSARYSLTTPVDTSVDGIASYVEGNVIPSAHALSFYVTGDQAPARINGFAADTQPRRYRYATPAPV